MVLPCPEKTQRQAGVLIVMGKAGIKYCINCNQDYPSHTSGCRALYWHYRYSHKMDHDEAYEAVGDSPVEFRNIFGGTE